MIPMLSVASGFKLRPIALVSVEDTFQDTFQDTFLDTFQDTFQDTFLGCVQDTFLGCVQDTFLGLCPGPGRVKAPRAGELQAGSGNTYDSYADGNTSDVST